MLSVGGDGESHCSKAEDNSAHDEGVVFPVGWLCVPTTGRRPDVLGETVGSWLMVLYIVLSERCILNLAAATHFDWTRCEGNKVVRKAIVIEQRSK